MSNWSMFPGYSVVGFGSEYRASWRNQFTPQVLLRETLILERRVRRTGGLLLTFYGMSLDHRFRTSLFMVDHITVVALCMIPSTTIHDSHAIFRAYGS